MDRRTPRARFASTLLSSLIILLAPVVVFAQADPTLREPLPQRRGDLSVKAEPGFAMPMAGPQHRGFKIGGSQTLKALWVLNRFVDVGPSITFMSVPSRNADSDSGTAWTFGGSLRVKRPHDALDDASFLAVSPWIDVDALYVRTGDLNRPGF